MPLSEREAQPVIADGKTSPRLKKANASMLPDAKPSSARPTSLESTCSLGGIDICHIRDTACPKGSAPDPGRANSLDLIKNLLDSRINVKELPSENRSILGVSFEKEVDDGEQATQAIQIPRNFGRRRFFVKAFMHNGYLLSLKEVVQFYNTRDKYAFNVQSGHCPKGTVEKVTCWPTPEEQDNKNMTIGNLGLTNAEENDLVAFMTTLVDGFVPITPTSLSKPMVVRKPALPPSHQ